jgi:hypothetical protein
MTQVYFILLSVFSRSKNKTREKKKNKVELKALTRSSSSSFSIVVAAQGGCTQRTSTFTNPCGIVILIGIGI